MNTPPTGLQDRIASGGRLLLAEIDVGPQTSAGQLAELARRYAGKVHALGLSDNRQRVGMAALAAATLVAAEGLEPILHVTTRDRNRIALVSEALGAQALGIRNILCTSGTHPVLGRFRAAKSVYDIDAVQLLQTYARLPSDAALVGEAGIALSAGFCLGAVASPEADPLALQVMRLGKKVAAGAGFLVTQPVYDLERFQAWWAEVTRLGIHRQVAILAGIRPLGEEDLEALESGRHPRPRIPESAVRQVTAKDDAAARQRAAVELALETAGRLSALEGLRGFSVSADGSPDAALEIIDKL